MDGCLATLVLLPPMHASEAVKLLMKNCTPFPSVIEFVEGTGHLLYHLHLFSEEAS
jgi:hypothetical protein